MQGRKLSHRLYYALLKRDIVHKRINKSKSAVFKIEEGFTGRHPEIPVNEKDLFTLLGENNRKIDHDTGFSDVLACGTDAYHPVLLFGTEKRRGSNMLILLAFK